MEEEPYSRCLTVDQLCAIDRGQAQVNSSLLRQKSPLWAETDFAVAVFNGDALCGIFSGVRQCCCVYCFCVFKNRLFNCKLREDPISHVFIFPLKKYTITLTWLFEPPPPLWHRSPSKGEGRGVCQGSEAGRLGRVRCLFCCFLLGLHADLCLTCDWLPDLKFRDNYNIDVVWGVPQTAGKDGLTFPSVALLFKLK